MLKQWLVNKLQGPIYLDCYTSSPTAYKVAPLRSAVHSIPKWWKDLPKSTPTPIWAEGSKGSHQRPTMRSCVGFLEFFKHSFCLPLWSDLALSIGSVDAPSCAWCFSDGQSEVTSHPPDQWGEFLSDHEYQQVKLMSPWLLVCDEPIKFLLLDPFWCNENKELLVAPGIAEFKHQPNTNVNLFIKRLPDIDREVHLKFGTPLLFMTPMTERKVILRHHLVTKEELTRIHKPRVAFVNAYAEARKASKMVNQQFKEEQTCPMKLK